MTPHPDALPAAPLLDAVSRAGRCDLGRYLPWFCAGRRIGWIPTALAEVLAGFGNVFRVDAAAVRLLDRFTGRAERSAAVNGVVRRIHGGPGFGRWNDEYGTVFGPDGEPLLEIARCATRPFGVRTDGAHVNGFVRTARGPRLWVAVRHRTNTDYGSLLDTLAGGYMTAGTTATEIAEREAAEEAGIPAGLMRGLTGVGTVRGCHGLDHGVTVFAVHAFDLELPDDFVPANHDGEVEGFALLGAAELLDALTADRFKFNAVPVVVDWLLRHGLVRPGSEAHTALPAALTTWDPE